MCDKFRKMCINQRVRSVQSYILHITGSYKKDRVCSVIDMNLICW